VHTSPGRGCLDSAFTTSDTRSLPTFLSPITYVAAQLGYAKPTTTLAHYAHWIPRGDKGWVDRLAEARQSGSTTKAPGVGHDATRN